MPWGPTTGRPTRPTHWHIPDAQFRATPTYLATLLRWQCVVLASGHRANPSSEPSATRWARAGDPQGFPSALRSVGTLPSARWFQGNDSRRAEHRGSPLQVRPSDLLVALVLPAWHVTRASSTRNRPELSLSSGSPRTDAGAHGTYRMPVGRCENGEQWGLAGWARWS